MYIDGIGNQAFREVQSKTNTNSTSSVGGTGFAESLKELALGVKMVVRGGEMNAAGLHEQKMVQDWIKGLEKEEEPTVDEIMGKLTRIDEILKEKFAK